MKFKTLNLLFQKVRYYIGIIFQYFILVNFETKLLMFYQPKHIVSNTVVRRYVANKRCKDDVQKLLNKYSRYKQTPVPMHQLLGL